jgi:hypothetical protein
MIRANDENQKYIQDFLNEEKNSFQLFSSKNGVNESNIPDIQGPNEENENDNIFDKSYLGSFLKHSYTSFNLFEFPNSNSGKTELNSIIVLSKRKRLRDKVTNEDKENSEDKIYKNNANIKKMGRRLKDKKYENEANHNKNSDDNIIIKLKTAIFKYILNLLNQSLEFTKYKFYPLNVKLSTCLKKEFNMELLERTIYDIYNTEDLNKIYINDNDSNKNLIKKIFEENVEKKAIGILKMKYKDVLNHIREKDLENFLKKIENKNREKTDDSFMDNVRHLLLTYEDWFKIKNGRNNKKIKSMK